MAMHTPYARMIRAAPYGYHFSDDGQQLVAYKPEGRIVKQVFQWYADGHTVAEIAQMVERIRAAI